MCVMYHWHVDIYSKGGWLKKMIRFDDRYPALNFDDSVSSYILEMQNEEPHKDTFLPLMKNTFRMRQHCILHDVAYLSSSKRSYIVL